MSLSNLVGVLGALFLMSENFCLVANMSLRRDPPSAQDGWPNYLKLGSSGKPDPRIQLCEQSKILIGL